MQVGILVTDGGPHSAEDWGYASASAILEGIPVDTSSSRKTKIEMAKDAARPQLAAIFQKHHDAVQSKERSALASGEHDRLLAGLNAAEHTDVESAISEVNAVLKPLLEKFGTVSSESLAALDDIARHRLVCDLNTTQYIERSWHADRNPTLPQAVAFRKGA